MCGICGKLNSDPEHPADPGLVRAMADAIRHRGPDDEGYYVQGPVSLGHRRLSIIDLSEAGRQPLSNEDGTVWVTFNGEIYNYQDLRRELESKGHVFRTATDSEVLVHLYEEEGEEMCRRLRGMFAFGIWDGRRRQLLLARDRVGIKPLYYAETAEGLSFASEMKALIVDPALERRLDAGALRLFLGFYYLPGERTLLKGVRRLPPGHILVARGDQVKTREYWDLQFTDERADRPVDDLVEELDSLLREVVKAHLISDVPIGFFLSGGVDSTAMLSYATEVSEDRFSSFTIGFEGESFPDERPYARLAAERFRTDHHELTFGATEFNEALADYVWHMEDPVCEPPAIALYYLARTASSGNKVMISGEGGDEAFAGYPNYRTGVWIESAKRRLGPLAPLAASLTPLMRRLGYQRTARYLPLFGVPLSRFYYSRTATPHSLFNQGEDRVFRREFLANLNGSSGSVQLVQNLFDRVDNQPALNQMLYVDTKTWLPDDLLIKADKMTMAHSLELRVPLLDHQVLEFAASLPPDTKLKWGRGKHLLSRTLKTRVPAAILTRRKAGFPVPYSKWLEQSRELILDSIHNGGLTRYSLDPSFRKSLLSGSWKGDRARDIFALTVLELWHQRFCRPTLSASRWSEDGS